MEFILNQQNLIKKLIFIIKEINLGNYIVIVFIVKFLFFAFFFFFVFCTTNFI